MSRSASRLLLGLGIAGLMLPIVALIAVFAVVAVAPASAKATAPSDGGPPASTSTSTSSTNPFGTRGLYASPNSKAAEATASAEQSGNRSDAEIFGRIAAQPTAIWIVPERNPMGQVGLDVAQIAKDARSRSETPVIVIYGIPDRDCGNQSQGGLTAIEYPLWIGQIGDSLQGSGAAVILEPDSLALADQCGSADRRVVEVSTALQLLTARGLTVYLDGGHSNWLPPTRMAELLSSAGVANARGFATNVSNYNSTSREVAYANELSSLTGGAHYVIDTGRNGNGSDGEWCNPSGRALGQPAQIESGNARHDANLWIKNPGESDGTCNGGPTAGDWWDANARELSKNAGW